MRVATWVSDGERRKMVVIRITMIGETMYPIVPDLKRSHVLVDV